MSQSKVNRKKLLGLASPWQIIWRNKLTLLGIIFITFWLLMAILAPLIAPFGPNDVNMAMKLKPPGTGGHLLGTDYYGRDLLSRVLFGAQISIWVGIISVGIGMIIGVPLGLIAGYFGGVVANVIMRIMDALLAFPDLVLAIAISVSIGRGPTSAMIATGIVSIPGYARITYAQTSSIKTMPYVEASRAVGVKAPKILFTHILPNCMPQLLVKATLGLGFAILTIASLSFLGTGVQPPQAEWGAMIAEGRRFIISGQWWVTAFPGFAIVTAILGFNLVGDGIRDIVDPRNRTI